MADTVNTEVVYDGQRNAVVKCTNESDGTGESAVVKVNVASLVPNPGVHLVLWRLKYNIATGVPTTAGTMSAVRLQSDASSLVDLLILTGWGTINFFRRGGLKTADGANSTGNITLTTVNFKAGSSYTLEFELKKGGPLVGPLTG